MCEGTLEVVACKLSLMRPPATCVTWLSLSAAKLQLALPRLLLTPASLPPLLPLQPLLAARASWTTIRPRP